MATLVKIWNFLKSLPRAAWEVVVIVVSILIALVATKKEHEAEVAKEAAQADGKDAVLAEKQAEVKKEDAQVVKEGEERKADKPGSPEELARDLNKK